MKGWICVLSENKRILRTLLHSQIVHIFLYFLYIFYALCNIYNMQVVVVQIQ